MAEDRRDARFEDAALSDSPLRLKAEGVDDLAVISALMQDAVARAADVTWMARKRRLVVLANRFRWEDAERAEAERRPFERVRTALTVEDVSAVRAAGVDPTARDAVVAVLAVTFVPAGDGEGGGGATGGTVTITCAEGVAFAADVEVLDVSLADVTRPWAAAAGRPTHED